MTKQDRERYATLLARIYHEWQPIADRLDPKRKHNNDAANALDTMVSAAKRAHWHLVKRMP